MIFGTKRGEGESDTTPDPVAGVEAREAEYQQALNRWQQVRLEFPRLGGQ